jgi:Protein of unknown function (DUF3800)
LHILYVDESGDLGAMPSAPAPNGNDQPVLAIGGLIINASRLEQITQDFLNLKFTWFPGLAYPSNKHLDKIIPEIKGADLRRNACRGSRNQRRHAIGFLDGLIRLLNDHDIKLIARVWVKALGQPFDGRPVYTSSIQALYTYFDHWLATQESFGFCIADSRDYLKNVNVAHSVFTQKYQLTSSVFGRILELPTFGHSENHAGIQLCDIVCSALLFPIATHTYCTGIVQNVHVQPAASVLRQRFGPVLKAMQHRYQEPTGRWVGGIVVSDAHQHRNASAMF